MPLVVAAAIIVVVGLAAAFESGILGQSGGKNAVGPQKSSTPALVSITGLIQANYPPTSLDFTLLTTGKVYSTPVTETTCAEGAGGVCFVYFLSVPGDSEYNVTAYLQGNSGVCNAGTVDVTTVGSYNVNVNC